jgi:hypothetical protein
MLNERNRVAAALTPATIPQALFCVDREPIGAAADRTWAFALVTSDQANAAASDLVLDPG